MATSSGALARCFLLGISTGTSSFRTWGYGQWCPSNQDFSSLHFP
jgi:hypothetical protein